MNDQLLEFSQFIYNNKEIFVILRIQHCTINYLRYQTLHNYYLQTHEVTFNIPLTDWPG